MSRPKDGVAKEENGCTESMIKSEIVSEMGSNKQEAAGKQNVRQFNTESSSEDLRKLRAALRGTGVDTTFFSTAGTFLSSI